MIILQISEILDHFSCFCGSVTNYELFKVRQILKKMTFHSSEPADKSFNKMDTYIKILVLLIASYHRNKILTLDISFSKMSLNLNWIGNYSNKNIGNELWYILERIQGQRRKTLHHRLVDSWRKHELWILLFEVALQK